MALDLYVGSLMRYYPGNWQTVGQRAAEELGISTHTVRTGGDPSQNDPDVVAEMLTAWRAYLAEGLGCATDWPEAADLPYWTTDRRGMASVRSS